MRRLVLVTAGFAVALRALAESHHPAARLRDPSPEAAPAGCGASDFSVLPAQKRRIVRCTTEAGQFPLRAQARGGQLVPGEATACALAVTRDDSRQWCKEVTLVSD